MVNDFHHVGCLVADIANAIDDYRVLHPAGEVSQVFHISDQHVKVCFFSIGQTLIEFVEPGPGAASLHKLLQKGTSFYHIGVFTDSMEQEIARLEENGYRRLSLFRSEAFGGRYCAFMLSNSMHLIELIERSAF